jgi:hypothetical protein
MVSQPVNAELIGLLIKYLTKFSGHQPTVELYQRFGKITHPLDGFWW